MNLHTGSCVGEPGLLESLIPVWGSGRESVNHFQQGNYVRSVFWGMMAISDVFLIKAVVVGGVKLVGKAGATLFAKEEVSIVGKKTTRSALGLVLKGPWRPMGHTWKLITSKRKYNWKNVFWDPRQFKTGSGQYWAIEKANGNSLQHLWVMNKSKWIPEGIRNSGLNLLEIPRGLNSWMGGRISREWAFRGGVTYLMRATYTISNSTTGYLTQKILDTCNNYFE